MTKTKSKTFLVINLSFFGDILLTNALFQNIKLNYPDSKIIFMVNKPFYEAALYQEGVDEVICFDKKGKHKGLIGLLKFLFKCPYKNKIDTSIILYANDRGILLSYLLKSKKRISSSTKITKFLLTDKCTEFGNFESMQDLNSYFISVLTGKPAKVLPIKYNTNPQKDPFVQSIKQQFEGKEIIGLVTTGKNKKNFMPIETAIEVIEKLNKEGKTIFYFGAGKDARNYADEIKKRGCVNFIDLTNATTISQLANTMKICQAVISIDTGVMHMAYATGTPTVCVFYRPHMIPKWGPRKSLYENTVIIDKNYTAENIVNSAIELIKKSN